MNNEPVAWMDKESNISMIGGIYPKKLEQYLNSLEARIVALEPHPVKEQDESFDRTASHMAGEYVSNTEPVAWIGETLMGRQYINGQKDELPVGTALYTHPVKELTDEEIVNLINKHIDYVPDGDGMKLVGVMEFARAILRKAQENG